MAIYRPRDAKGRYIARTPENSPPQLEPEARTWEWAILVAAGIVYAAILLLPLLYAGYAA